MSTATIARPAPASDPRAPMHWLVRAAQRAGIVGAADLSLPQTTTIVNAWDAVMRALGLTGNELARLLAPTLGVAVADLETAQRQALRLIPEKLARRLLVFPLAEDDRTLLVATANPNDLDVEQAVGFASGRRVIFVLAPPLSISDAIDAGYAPDRTVERLLERVDDELSDTVRVVAELEPEMVAEQEVLAGPVVKLTNLILRDAVESGASDIHIEPAPQRGYVRFRIDGVMRRQMQLPSMALNRVVSRIKVLSKLDIADRLRPQDGRARIEVGGRAFDLRVSTVPTREAEKAVIRILRPDTAKGLRDCGLADRDLARVMHLLSFRDGLVIVTGPTGSGKTTTLYSALKEVAKEDLNVMTVEDPIEYELPGITQMQVEPKRNVTFASALRAILRQDPDVIFVGEIRDAETAHVAAQAAMTGHLVLATLHTNDAVGAVARLADLGLERATIAATLRGVIAQRLMRRVCRDCAQAVTGALTEQEQRLAAGYGTPPVVRAVGCRSCGNTGYRGRQPIVEVATMTSATAELIASGATAQALQRSAVAGGMHLLREAAVLRVASGESTLQEMERVLGDVTEEAPPVDATTPGTSPAALRILVVDDDAVIRHLATATLQQAGFTVDAVDDGETALQRLATGERWNLVLSDLDMVRVNGEELLQAIRTTPATAELPVIVLTGSSGEETEVRLIDAGANDYMRKPIDPARLISRVKAALRRVKA